MKNLFAAGIACLWNILVFAQSDAQKIDTAKALISRKQYSSAYKVLETCQGSPELVVTVSKLLTNHHSGISEDFHNWMLQDQPGGQTNRYDLQLENFLWEAIAAWPSDCNLYTAVCELYALGFEIRGRYIEHEALKAISDAIAKRVQPKCPGYLSNYVLGYCSSEIGDAQAAIPYLQKAISLNASFSRAHLQLSRSYLQKNDLQNALKSAKTAFQLSSKRTEKSEAALISGKAYEALNDNPAALTNYLLADSLNRKEFFIQQALLNFYVKTNNSKAPAMLNSFIGAQGRSTLHFYIDAFEIYKTYGRLADLAMFCQKGLSDYKGTGQIEGCLNFTLGKIYQGINADMAKQYFKAAKSNGIKADTYFETRNHPDTGRMIEDAYKTIQ